MADKVYQGKDITVTYGVRRCIHMAECVHGDIEIITPDGTVMLKDIRVALCRCGASKNKPFCDNSHSTTGFEDPGLFQDVHVKPDKESDDRPLRVRPARNGPLLIQGSLELVGAEATIRGSQTALCRCGGSSNKPFCDGTHSKLGFTSE